jgi:NAD(P)-dependent dehydrogenase (short-subunit alcohol dehydrogenase family)
MRFEDRRVVVTGASRDFGRALAIRLADLGAEVFLTARTQEAACRTAAEIEARVPGRVHPLACDLADPESVRGLATALHRATDRVDLLVNNGARWLEGADLASAGDDAIVETVASACTGTVLTVKHLLPLLRRSSNPDIVTMVSVCGLSEYAGSSAHDAFYAGKSAQRGFVDILSRRLRPEGIRVISLYPPDFRNSDPMSPDWDAAPRGSGEMLTAQSLIDCILFAVAQPRDCFIRSFHFEPS